MRMAHILAGAERGQKQGRGRSRFCHDGPMDAALGSPTPEALVSAWRWQPLCVALVVLAALWYALAVRRLPTRRRWPWGRTASFGVGLALFVWATCGFLGVYANALFWVWTTQMLVLLLVVPTVVMAGRPVVLSGLRRG